MGGGKGNSGADMISSAASMDSTSNNTTSTDTQAHIRVTLHQYSEHTVYNKNNTTKSSSNVVLDYTGPLSSADSDASTTNTNSTSTTTNICTLQSYIHQLTPLPESTTNIPNSVSSLLTQLTFAFAHSTMVKYVEVEVEVCSAPKSVFDTIEHFKYNNGSVDSDSVYGARSMDSAGSASVHSDGVSSALEE